MLCFSSFAASPNSIVKHTPSQTMSESPSSFCSLDPMSTHIQSILQALWRPTAECFFGLLHDESPVIVQFVSMLVLLQHRFSLDLAHGSFLLSLASVHANHRPLGSLSPGAMSLPSMSLPMGLDVDLLCHSCFRRQFLANVGHLVRNARESFVG